MGVKGIKKLIELKAPSCLSIKNPHEFNGKILAVDLSIQIHRSVIGIRGNRSGKDLETSYGKFSSHIYGIFHIFLKMLENGSIPVIIADGSPPDIKKCTLIERKKKKIKAKEDLCLETYKSEEEKVKLLKRTYCIKDEHIRDIKRLSLYMGLPFIQALGEAEAQCAALNIAGKVEGTITQDWDILPFGGLKMLKNFSNKKLITEIDLLKMLKELDLTHEQFIELCILLGTDYCPGIKGLGPITLYEFYRKSGNIENFLINIKKKNDNLVNSGKQSKYIIPDDLENSWRIIKNYYMNAEIINPDSLDIKWNEPDYENLLCFLCHEFEFDYEKTYKKIQKLKKLYQNYSKNGYISGGSLYTICEKSYPWQKMTYNQINCQMKNNYHFLYNNYNNDNNKFYCNKGIYLNGYFIDKNKLNTT